MEKKATKRIIGTIDARPLRIKRESLRLNQESVAAELGIHRVGYHNAEVGNVRISEDRFSRFDAAINSAGMKLAVRILRNLPPEIVSSVFAQVKTA